MNREIYRALAEGAIDALRLHIALVRAPFDVAKAFVMRPAGTRFEYIPHGERAASTVGEAGDRWTPAPASDPE
jgi:hypothetical protein